MELKKITSKNEWDEFVGSQEQGSLLQSWAWREFQILEKRTAESFFVIDNGQVVAAACVFKVSFPGHKYYLYCPRGPVFKNGLKMAQRRQVLNTIAKEINKTAQFKEALFFRIDPAVDSSFINLHSAGFVKANKETQPRQTMVLNLGFSEEELFKNMKSKTRYNIRLAEKRGVNVITARNEQDIEKFYELTKSTTEQKEFSAHPKKYYFDIWQALAPQHLKVYLAEYEGKIIAALMAGNFGGKTIYLHGASSYKERTVMAPYLLQWKAMQDSKNNGNSSYDLWGVAPKGAENHPWTGVTRFKEGFGGQYVEYLGTYDYVYKPFWYKVFNFARNVKKGLR